MPEYKITAPGGNSYRITGPPGASDEDVQREVMRQNPHLNAPPPVTAPAGPPDLTSMLKTGYQGVSGALGRAKQGTQKMLEAGGAVPPEIAAMANPVPGSIPEAVVAAVTAGLPFMKLGGGPIKQFAKSTAIGAATGAGLGTLDAAARDEDLIPGALQGMAAGGAGGALAGAGQAFTAWKYGDTKRALQAVAALKAEPSVSPAVRGMIPANPQALFERDTGRQLQAAASRMLETELTDLQTRAPGTFAIQSVSKPPPSPAGPDKLSRLQSVNWVDLPSGTHPVVDVKSGQKLVAALREVGEDSMARQAEKEIIQNLTTRSPELGARYQRMIGQYSNDQKLIGTLSALRDFVELPGGGGPTEFPKIAEAAKLLGMSKVETSPEAHALMNALLAASHPTSFYGAGHAVGALRDFAKRGMIDPTKLMEAIPGIRRLWEIPAAGLGVRIGEGMAPGANPP